VVEGNVNKELVMMPFERTAAGLCLAGSIVVAAIAAPECRSPRYNNCEPESACGVEGQSVTVCENVWVSVNGKYKPTGNPKFVSEPAKCYTLSVTTWGACNPPPGSPWEKFPSCTKVLDATTCCYYDSNNPPTITTQTPNILRPNQPVPCLGGVMPVVP
jgi:hypothetical protein